MNLLAIDRLELELSDDSRRQVDAYRRFLENQAANYQRLNAAYLEALLRQHLPHPQPDYAVCVVGTPSDQDDVDILIISGPDSGDAALNRAMGRAITEFFRRAGRLHLYVAEGLGKAGYVTTVDDYARLLEHRIPDFVMISELLSARLLVGSPRLLNQFHAAVTDRFYGLKPEWRKFHEGFLRGLLGEMHNLLTGEVSRERIDFKNDALRLGKGMALAGKVVHGIRQVGPLSVLSRLQAEHPDLAEEYEALADCLVFLDAFRLLYQMLGVQDEEVDLADGGDPVLGRVAEVMGYSERAGVSAAEHLLVNYFESVERVRLACRKLLHRLTDYVRRLSAYTGLAGNEAADGRRNLARDLADSVRFFSGHIFFDDVLEALARDHGRLSARLVEDAAGLLPEERAAVIESFLAFADSDLLTLLELMLTVAAAPSPHARPLFDSLLDFFLRRLSTGSRLQPALLQVYATHPAVVNRFVETITPRQRQAFERLLDVELVDDEQQEQLARLKRYIWLRTAGSEFYRRVFRRVTGRFPQFIHHLDDVPRLRHYASGFLAGLPFEKDLDKARQAAADAYDTAYLACAVEALRGHPLAGYRPAFVESVDGYLRTLYALCRRAVDQQFPARPECRDRFALLAAGGYGRGQAFDDDYDLLPLVDADDPDLVNYFCRVAARMHRDLIRRGTLPQYRFADHFGRFVTSVPELRQWLAAGPADTVDRCQLLEARLVVGSSRLAALLHDEVVEPLVLRGGCMTQDLLADLAARHAAAADLGRDAVNIKEDPGGLRDMEQILLAGKALCRLRTADTALLARELAQHLPEIAPQLTCLEESHDLLRSVRNLYRLAVAARDDMVARDLPLVARIMGIPGPDGNGDGPALFARIRETMAATRLLVADLSAVLRTRPTR
jgi:hypothetical protein